MSKVLVVGAGYLGGDVVRAFRQAGWVAQGVSLGGGEGLLACDVSDEDSVSSLPDADAVVHCAASGRAGEEAYLRVYLEGCRNLVRRFPEARLLFTSSSSVYAQTGGELVTEVSETIPERGTGKILLEAERVILDAGGVVARLAGIYGPGRSVLLRKFLDGEAVIEDEGQRFINMIHRDDAARAILHLISLNPFSAGEIFNVADSETMTQLRIYQRLAQIFGKDLPMHGPRDLNRKRGWTHKRVSNAKLCTTGWKPIYPNFFDAVTDL